MTPEQSAALVMAQSVNALIEALAMQAENKQAEIVGNSMPYVEQQFFELIDKYGLGYNTVMATYFPERYGG